MPDNCTIYCASDLRSEVLQLLSDAFAGATHTPRGPDWQSVTVHGNSGSLCLNALIYRENGDEFTRLRGSTRNFIVSRCTGVEAIKKELSRKVADCHLILGVVCEPEFEADERYESVLFAIAENLDGVIFNGTQFMNADAEVLAEYDA